MLLELYRKQRRKATARGLPRRSGEVCYNFAETQQVKRYQQYERGTRLKRAVLLLGTAVPLLFIASCSSNNSVTGPNGNVSVNSPSKLQHRAFITNQFAGAIQIMDSQNDTTAFYTVTNNNTGITGPGVTGTAVQIIVGNSLTFAVESPDNKETVVYDPSTFSLNFIDNSTETSNGAVHLPNYADMAVFSPDSTVVYAPVPNATITVPNTSTNTLAGGVAVHQHRHRTDHEHHSGTCCPVCSHQPRWTDPAGIRSKCGHNVVDRYDGDFAHCRGDLGLCPASERVFQQRQQHGLRAELWPGVRVQCRAAVRDEF